ncbi:hypothetical protein LZ554_005865 [Drepanopeziza brunnea f. sp. 'monogermtubi']|nr:hypothetical protein LZ554_005865 [Drepanopeziza brunnea f. sp. 'monogermtubi']
MMANKIKTNINKFATWPLPLLRSQVGIAEKANHRQLKANFSSIEAMGELTDMNRVDWFYIHTQPSASQSLDSQSVEQVADSTEPVSPAPPHSAMDEFPTGQKSRSLELLEVNTHNA